MQKRIKLLSILIFLTTTGISSFWGQNSSIEFYGVLSQDADLNMINMTEDMFFKQLSEMFPGAQDRRNEKSTVFYDMKNSQPEKLINSNEELKKRTILLVYIEKADEITGTWKCKTIYHKSEENQLTTEKEYDSYYKILMESKNILSEILSKKETIPTEPAQTRSLSVNSITTETLAGTWGGETYINKIVIMRGGRGFVIFNNGASMNISVKVTVSGSSNSVTIMQTSSSNASFFPELPRKAALELATNANPIQWHLTYNSDGSLTGKKITVALNESNSTVPAELPVKWIKK